MILRANLDRYVGKKIQSFEDEYGNKLDDLVMIESVVIVFDDGEKITLKQDWRGSECYFSQYTNKR